MIHLQSGVINKMFHLKFLILLTVMNILLIFIHLLHPLHRWSNKWMIVFMLNPHIYFYMQTQMSHLGVDLKTKCIELKITYVCQNVNFLKYFYLFQPSRLEAFLKHVLFISTAVSNHISGSIKDITLNNHKQVVYF